MEVRKPLEICPDPETLAAFLDGRLVEPERRTVEAHLAGCELCYETFRESARLLAAPPVSPVRRALFAALPLAAAAVLAFVLLRPALPPAVPSPPASPAPPAPLPPPPRRVPWRSSAAGRRWRHSPVRAGRTPP